MVAGSIVPSLSRENQNAIGPLVAWGVLIISIIGASVGSKLRHDYKNQPHARQLEEYDEAWAQEMRDFGAWKAQRSAVGLESNEPLVQKLT